MKRNILKKIAAVFLLAALLLPGAQRPALAAGAETADFTVPAGGYDGKPVTIRFYHSIDLFQSNIMDRYITEFNILYPNITIELIYIGDNDDIYDRISTEITVGSQPHIACCDPDDVALYNLAGAVTQLDDLIDSEITVIRADGSPEMLGLTEAQKDDFIAGFYNGGRQFGDGRMYTMPLFKSTEVLYYNKTFFEEHDLTVPTTWEEMEATCAAIKVIDPIAIPLGYDSDSNWFITMCEQYDSPYTNATGDHYLFNNDTNRSFVKMLRKWYYKGYVTTQNLYGAYTSGLFTTLDGIRSYMSIGSSTGAPYQRPAAGVDGSYPFEVGIATIPQVDAENPKVTFKGSSLCVFQKDDPQEVIASWLFVKFLTTNTEFQADFSKWSGSYIPVLKSVGDDPGYAAYLANADAGIYISALSAKVCLEQEAAYFTPPAFCGSSTVYDQVGALLSKCLSADSDGNVDAMIEEEFRETIEHCESEYDTASSDPLARAQQYLFHVYKNADPVIPADYSRTSCVTIDGILYPVAWSADHDSIRIIPQGDGTVTVDVTERNTETVSYTLTATVSNPQGESKTVSFSYSVPAAIILENGASYEEIVNAAYQLEDGKYLDGTFRLLGRVTRIDTLWSEDYQNITVTIQVGDLVNMPIMCYRLRGEGAKNLTAGDEILVEGQMKNYKGTIEFDAGCMLIEKSRLELNRTALHMNEGSSFPLSAAYSSGNPTEGIVWQSSDESVVRVSETGQITAVSAGTATITASRGTLSAECAVTVRVCPEEAYTLNAVVMKQGNNVLDGIYPFSAFDVVVSITENEAMEDAVILVATYTSEGKMLEFHILPMTFQTGIQQTAGVEIDNGNCNIGEIRVFVLYSLSGLLPLTECKSLK